MKRTIWITGASGFVGGHLTRYFEENEPDTEVLALDRVPPDRRMSATRFLQLDISDPRAIADLLSKKPPSIVYNMVGSLPPAEPKVMWRVNAGIAQRLALTLAKYAPHAIRLVSTGSAAEYGEPSGASLIREDFVGIPTTDYGESKLAGTNLLLRLSESSNLDVIVVRPFNFIGPGLSPNLVLGKICEQVRSGNSTIRVGPLEPVRDFLDVRDASWAYALFAEKGEGGQIYNLCSGEGHSIREALDVVVSLAPQEIKVEHKTGIPPGVARAVGCCEKLHAATGWSPRISFETSIADMLGLSNFES